jgi:hypothetical protein
MSTGTAAQAGKPITIQLSSGGIQANFDSVKLKGSSPPSVPEPSTFIMLGAGLLPVFGMVRRRYLKR